MITETKRTLHPLILIACVAILLFSATGIAAVMDWIPDSMGRNADNADVVSDAKPLDVKTTVAAKTIQPVKKQEAPLYAASNTKEACANCGVIESVRVIEARGEGSGVGAVGGAVVGGLLGNQVGGGSGKDAMTVAGAIGGAFAGHHIEKRVKSSTSYEVTVRMDNGSSRAFNQTTPPAWRGGDHVKIVDGSIRNS